MNTKIKDIIEYFGKHDASEPTKQKVWRLMAAHRDDAEADAAYRELWKEAGEGELDDGRIDEAYRQFGEALGDGSRKKHIVRPLWLKIAAVLVPLLVIVSVVAFYRAGVHEGVSEQMAMIQRQTAPGDSAVVTLPDGSRVRLREGSVLLYPSSFENGGRKIYLVGRATFEVRHDEANPLKVVTPYFEITDLGTVFDITSYPDAEESTAAVSSGKIALRVSGSDKVYDMSENDMLIYNVKTGNVLAGKRDELSPKWKRSQVNLDDVSFAEAVSILSNNYDVAFAIRNHKYDAMHITVHFNTGETLENTMEVISTMLPGLKYEIAGKTVIIK